MSRARPLGVDRYGNTLWWDRRRDNEKASVEQLELLAAADNILIDDLLDEGLKQGEVLLRLREALGEGVIPAEVLDRRRKAKELAVSQDICRICSEFGWECEGSITRHHFIPRWLMLQLENYQAYAARIRCTIPICIGRHRDLHLRNEIETPKSISQFLNDQERAFAQKMMDELKEQHPAIFDLILAGDGSTYEAILAQDYIHGAFRKASEHSIAQNKSAVG